MTEVDTRESSEAESETRGLPRLHPGEASVPVLLPEPKSRPHGHGLSVGAACLLAITALAVRGFGLGTFSLWLDEMLTLDMATGSFAEVLRRSAHDLVHPPLANLLAWTLGGSAAPELLHRSVAVALGVVGLLALAQWTATHFGPRAGLLVGGICTLAPFHVRYSHEVRPYVLLMLFVALALLAADRSASRGSTGSFLALSAALAGGLYSHYFFALAVPAVLLSALAASPRPPCGRGRQIRSLAAALAVAGIAFLPWAAIVLRAVRTPPGGTASWGLADIGLRWQFLTIGAREGEPLTIAGAALALPLLVGLMEACRRGLAGLAVIMGAVLGTVGAEALLAGAGHWSAARYDAAGWLFLAVLIGLGADAIAQRQPWRAARALPAVLVLMAFAAGFVGYDTRGRQDWRLIATALSSIPADDEKIWVVNDWSAISLNYYLARRQYGPRAEVALDVETLRTASRGILVVAGNPVPPDVRRLIDPHRPVATLPFTDNAMIFLAPESMRPRARALPRALRMGTSGGLARVRRLAGDHPPAGLPYRYELDDRTTEGDLAFGWSHRERTRAGETFVWALGAEAVLSAVVAEAPRSLAVRLWPYASPGQRVTVSVNDLTLESRELSSGPQVLEIALAPGAWRDGENLLRFAFAHSVAPRDVEAGSTDARALAAAFDWIELRP